MKKGDFSSSKSWDVPSVQTKQFTLDERNLASAGTISVLRAKAGQIAREMYPGLGSLLKRARFKDAKFTDFIDHSLKTSIVLSFPKGTLSSVLPRNKAPISDLLVFRKYNGNIHKQYCV